MTGKHCNLKNCVSRQQIYQEIDQVSMYYGKEKLFFSRMTLVLSHGIYSTQAIVPD